MRELVALDMPASNEIVSIIKSVWEDGDAFIPIDQRLPQSAKRKLLEEVQPSQVLDSQWTRIKLANGRPVEDGQCLAMATSGTTGTPKVVMYDMRHIEASARTTSTFIGVNKNDRWLCCLPIAHIGGLSVILRSIITELEVEVHNGFNAEQVVNAASRGSTLVSLVPATLMQINPSMFRKIILGGSKPPLVMPDNAFSTYGLTETGSGVVYNHVPLPGLEIKISDKQQVLLRGPMIAKTYRNGSAICDDHGWLHTNDAGEFSNGKLQIFGRLDEVINSGGEKVFPALVESVLSSNAKIAKMAILGTPDPKWGEAVTAVIVPKSNSLVPTLEELRTQVKEHLPSYAAPTKIILVQDLPMTSLGKIQKQVLLRQLKSNQVI